MMQGVFKACTKIRPIHSMIDLRACFIATFSSRSNRSGRRTRRTRQLEQRKKSKDNVSVATRLSEFRESINMISNLGELSQNGLTSRVEMPQEMINRLTSIVKRRTHSQLTHLREKMLQDEANKEHGVPLDMHTRPLGWALESHPQIKPYLYGPSETMGYLAFDVEHSYACIHHAFRQLLVKNKTFAPESMLDFGAGPGTASWAAKEFFSSSLSRYRMVEPSQSMVDAGEILLEGFPGLSIRRSLSEMKRELQKGVRYDLVVVNFVLSEITNDFERVAVMSALWEMLGDNGILVIVDRGSTWGSHQVRTARQFILDSLNKNESEGAKILAPCPHELECGAQGKTWCHFVQRSPRVQFPRDATTKRWHGHKGSKFSYVVMQKQKADTPTKPEHGARLIRGPILATRHVHLDLCTPNGAIERRPVTKGKALREVYRASRKAHWGALWPADESTYIEEK